MLREGKLYSEADDSGLLALNSRIDTVAFSGVTIEPRALSLAFCTREES